MMMKTNTDVTYSKWFASQDEDFQKLALGTKRFNAYKAGTYKVNSLDDIRGRTPLSLEQIKSYLIEG